MIPNTTAWGNKPINEYDIWEQREIWSYHHIVSSPNLNTVKEIVNCIIQNKEFTYTSQLTLLDEALIQRLLRFNGFELKCYNLNSFPNSTTELQKYILPMDLTEKVKNTTQFFNGYINQFKYCLNNFYYNYQPIILTLAVIFGLIFYHHGMIWWGIFTAWITSPILTLIYHEYWEHQIIKPKNRFIGYLFDYITYVLAYSNNKKGAVYHRYHHIYFLGDKDLTYYEVSNNHFLRWFFRYKLKTNQPLMEYYDMLLRNDYEPIYNKFDPVCKFLEDHYVNIVLFTHALLLFFMPFEYYFYFVILPIWWHRISLYSVIEIVSHKICKNEQDFPWAYPLVFNLSYHNSHHKYADKLIIGPKPLRYFNPQYYFVKLLYDNKFEIY